MGKASVGESVRSWRRRRNLTQHALAASAGVSTRYLSFIETGRAQPSRAMVVRLARALALPLEDCNGLLVTAGYAPMFAKRELGDPSLEPVRHALARTLAALEPYPALLVDRCWNIRASNRGARLLTNDVTAQVLEPTPNLVRLMLHPAGLGGRTGNLEEWGSSLLQRIQERAERTCDAALERLFEEASRYLGVAAARPPEVSEREPLLLQRLRTAAGEREIALFPTVTAFATATDVTVAELTVEAFFPADEATRLLLAETAAPARRRADAASHTHQLPLPSR